MGGADLGTYPEFAASSCLVEEVVFKLESLDPEGLCGIHLDN